MFRGQRWTSDREPITAGSCEDRPGPGKLAETIDALRMLGVDDAELAEVGVLDMPQSVPADAVIR